MTTVFYKRISKIGLAIIALFFVLTGGYAYAIKTAEIVPVFRSYYFLVSTSTHIQASTQQTLLSGGAGYPLEKDGDIFVTIAVYSSENSARRAQGNLSEETQIIELAVDKLYFKGIKKKRTAKAIISAFSCLDDCIEVLEGEIVRLDDGATQNSSKRVLRTLSRQFSFLSQRYEETLPAFSTVFMNANAQIERISSGIVYASKLRYLLCDLCFSFVKLGEEFSL